MRKRRVCALQIIKNYNEICLFRSQDYSLDFDRDKKISKFLPSFSRKIKKKSRNISLFNFEKKILLIFSIVCRCIPKLIYANLK